MDRWSLVPSPDVIHDAEMTHKNHFADPEAIMGSTRVCRGETPPTRVCREETPSNQYNRIFISLTKLATWNLKNIDWARIKAGPDAYPDDDVSQYNQSREGSGSDQINRDAASVQYHVNILRGSNPGFVSPVIIYDPGSGATKILLDGMHRLIACNITGTDACVVIWTK